MRGMVEGLPNPHPLGLQLPAMFQEDDFAQRFVSALDDVIAPVLSTLDCMDAYFDPTLAPPDFLPWLAGWTGADLDETWTEEQQREVLAGTAPLHARRGTVQGLQEVLRLATGFAPEIDDSGGAGWSPTPGADLPGREEIHVTIRVRGEDLSEKRIAGLVAEHIPAHVPWTIELESAT